MFGMMRDGIMTGPMTWGMGLGMGLVAVVLVLGAVTLINIWSPVRGRSHHAVRHAADILVNLLTGIRQCPE